MKGTVLTGLLALCVALVPGKENLVLKDFDAVKFSGFWYEIAFASKFRGSPPKVRKVGAVLVELEGDHLALTTSYDDEDGCVKEKRLALKGDVPGKFRLPKDLGDKEVLVVAIDYDSFAIMDVILHQGASSFRVLKLYSRAPEHNQEALSRFQLVAKEYGFSAGDVYQLTQDMTCVNLLRLGGAPSS